MSWIIGDSFFSKRRRYGMITLNPQYEEIFDPRHLDMDCDRILLALALLTGTSGKGVTLNPVIDFVASLVEEP